MIHESNLPKNKGYSPIQWQILNNKKFITISLFKITKNIDSGEIVLKDKLNFNGTELYDEIREKQAKISLNLINQLIKYKKKIKFVKQRGKSSILRKRTPSDSKLNPNKSIISQFNLLRICNNKDWPAYFMYKKTKYIIKIYKNKNLK